MVTKDALSKALKAAAWTALPGALLSLLVCMLMLGSGAFQMLLPLWLGILFTAISLVLARIPGITRRLWLRAALSMAAVALTVLFLRLF